MRGDRTFVALMLVLILVVPILGCGGYGALLHTQVVKPFPLNVEIGPAHLLGGAFPPMCETAPHCTSIDMVYEMRRTYRVRLFIRTADTNLFQLARITLPLP
jgi:hypothetical protein